MPGSANTHWLNSFFMKLFSLFWGDAPGFLRLHSVIAYPFFAMAIIRLSNFTGKWFLGLFFFCLVIFNPYIIDFFSLARGYGLALTFQAWVLVYFIRAATAEDFHYRDWLHVLILSSFMLASNLSYLYSVLGIAFFFAVKAFVFPGSGYSIKSKQVNIILGLFFLLIFFCICDLMFIKYYGKDLEFGGDSEFLQSLFGSVWKGSLYFYNPSLLETVMIYGSFLLLIVSAIFFSYQCFKKQKLNKGLLLMIVVLAILLLNLAFHLAFNTPFLYGRTALQWYVPSILMIVLLLNEWLKSMKNILLPSLGILASGLIVFHFAMQARLGYCFEWRNQAETDLLMKVIKQVQPKNMAIGNYGVYANYYKLLDADLAKLPIKNLVESKLVDCNPQAMKELDQFDYIAPLSVSTIDCLKKTGIPFSIVWESKSSNEKLIKLH